MEDLRFARVWQKLRECYSNNGRSIEHAYGYFSEIDNLYSNVVGGTTVQRIVLTNVRVERAEHRDALVAAATNKGIFYAVLTLTATEDVSVATGRGDWWQESLVFAGIDREDIFAHLFNDSDRVDKSLEEEEEDPQEVMEEESPFETEEREERLQFDAEVIPDVPLLETHPLLTEEMDVSTCHYFDSSDEEEDDVNGNAFQLDAIGLEVGVRESQLHDNFRKKPTAFFRKMNSSATTWAREIYRHFFSSFYQETKRLPRTDLFKGPLVEYI